MDTTNVPMARELADNKAMAESPCIFVLFSFKIINDDIRTTGIARYNGVMFKMVAIAKAPKPTWDRPSPIMEFFLRTNDTPIKDEHMDIRRPEMKALWINGYVNI